MKHTLIRFILSTTLLLSLTVIRAQEVESDSAASGEKSVQVAYREVAQDDIMTSVSYLDMEELASKSYNTWSTANLNALVTGYDGDIWGQGTDGAGYLVLVDGVPRDANNVLQTEIESISILKSASAVVLYGSRATKGVISITTKRGSQKEMQIDVRANTGFYFAKAVPNFLSSAEYMTYYNQALINDGKAAQYSDMDIYNSASGTNPYRYPNVDFFSDDFIKNTYNRTDVTAELSGGNEVARFYSNIGYQKNGSYLNFGESANDGSDRLNIRGNVDFTISKRITAFVHANTTFYNSYTAKGNFWGQANTFRPNYISPLIPTSMIADYATEALNMMAVNGNITDDGMFLSGSQTYQTHAFGDMAYAGSSQGVARQLQFDTGINVDMGFLTEGLNFRTTYATDYANGYTISYNDAYAIYEPTWGMDASGNDVITSLKKYGDDTHSGTQNISNSATRQTIAFKAMFDYARSFGNHNVSALLMADMNQTTFSTVYHKPSYATFGAQATYNYKQKYYVDAALAYVHSAKFAEGNRGAFSPSITLGWNAANEEFLKGSIVNNLTLSASASVLNTDTEVDGYYLHSSKFENTNDSYQHGWNDGNGVHLTISDFGGNPDLTYVTREELSANLNVGLWDNMITAQAAVYQSDINGIIGISPTKYPSYFNTSNTWAGNSFLPYENLNSNRISGAELAINFNKRINSDLAISVGAIANYSKSIATVRDEVKEFDYQKTVGTSTTAIWGYENLGFFATDADAAAANQMIGDVEKAGDIAYMDQNGDDKIDTNDQVIIGDWASPYKFGVNFTLKYKGFTLYAIGSASVGGQGIKNSGLDWISGTDKYTPVVRDSWTAETADTATYPRLTTATGNNNFCTSDFWLYDQTRFDLDKVQLTYDFPASMFGKGFIKGLSAYVAGYDLLTIATEKERFETNLWGGAPYSRFVNGGIKITF